MSIVVAVFRASSSDVHLALGSSIAIRCAAVLIVLVTIARIVQAHRARRVFTVAAPRWQWVELGAETILVAVGL